MLEDGIQAVRMAIPKMWFNEGKTDRLVESLRQYQRDWDDKGKTWRGRPRHDWTSHGADSVRYLVLGRQDTSAWGDKPLKRGIAVY